MHILAFDTCLGAVSVAIAAIEGAEPRVVCERHERRTSGHAERLMPMIEDAMAEASIGFAEVDRIAVTVGPGSFTGVRTGIAAARGLALATGRPAAGVTTLAAIAFGARRELAGRAAERPIAVALDAGRGRVFFQIFGPGGEEASGPLHLAPEECAARLGASPALIAGSAAAAVVAAGARAEACLPDADPRASSIALMVPARRTGEPLRPLYLRPPDAKPQAGKALPRARA